MFVEFRRTGSRRAPQRARRAAHGVGGARGPSLRATWTERRRSPPGRVPGPRQGRRPVRARAQRRLLHVRRPHHRGRDQAPLPRPHVDRARAPLGQGDPSPTAPGHRRADAAPRSVAHGRRSWPSTSASTPIDVIEGIAAGSAYSTASLDAPTGQRRRRNAAARRRRRRFRSRGRRHRRRGDGGPSAAARTGDRAAAVLRGAQPERDRRAGRHLADARVAPAAPQLRPDARAPTHDERRRRDASVDQIAGRRRRVRRRCDRTGLCPSRRCRRATVRAVRRTRRPEPPGDHDEGDDPGGDRAPTGERSAWAPG